MIQPMLVEKVAESRLLGLCEDDRYFAEQKVNGDRLLMHVGDGKAQAVSRNGLALAGVKPMLLDQFKQLPGQWLFDGEHLDRRMFVFDVLIAGGTDMMAMPLEFRRDVLERFYAQWQPNDRVILLPVARTHEAKCDLAQHVIAAGLEGIVFKPRDGLYVPGNRGQWIAVKFRNDIDVVVMDRGRGHDNLVMGVYRDGILVEVGEVTALAGDGPKVKVGDVITVMCEGASENDRIVQPTKPMIRQDVRPEACVYQQLDKIRINRAVRR